MKDFSVISGVWPGATNDSRANILLVYEKNPAFRLFGFRLSTKAVVLPDDIHWSSYGEQFLLFLRRVGSHVYQVLKPWSCILNPQVKYFWFLDMNLLAKILKIAISVWTHWWNHPIFLFLFTINKRTAHWQSFDLDIGIHCITLIDAQIIKV